MRIVHKLTKPRLGRMSLIKSVLQGYRSRLDEELQPHGITTAQLRLLWTIEENPLASGAKVARLCSVTPQTGQAGMTGMEANGWIRRRASEASDRVLVAEVTTKGKRVLVKGRKIAEDLDRELWKGSGARELRQMETVLRGAMERLSR
jgi:DNA-binding MarR family transcriptional regulator